MMSLGRYFDRDKPADFEMELQLGTGSDITRLIPVSWIELRGAELWSPGQEIPLAYFVNWAWQSEGRAFDEISAHAFVTARFSAEGEPSAALAGPRPSFLLRGAHLFLGREYWGALDPELALWRDLRTRKLWSRIVITGDRPIS